MGYIKEPKGIDFTVINKGLSDKERFKITEFIQKYKAKMAVLPKPKKPKKDAI